MATLAVAVALLGVAWLLALLPYRLREPSAPGRPLLVALRTGTLFLLALLLWNPSVGDGEPVPTDHGQWVLLDRTLGMGAVDPDGVSAWNRGVEEAQRQAEEGARVAVYDGALEMVERGELPELEPGASGRELEAAVEGALEAGAGTVELISDFRITDGHRIAGLGGWVPGGLRVRPVGGEVRNAGLAELRIPSRVEAGDSLRIGVVLHGEGVGEGETADLVVREAGEELARETLPAVVGQGTRAHDWTLPPFQDEGLRRLEVQVELEGDGFPHDDRRVAYVTVEEARRGIVLVALDPGWEGRQLLPVLERATDLEGVGFLRLAGGEYLEIRSDPAEVADPDAAPGPGGPVDSAEVADRLEQARVVVLVGLGGDPPEEVRAALEEAPALLAMPAEPAAGEWLGLPLDGPRSGEWQPAPELPSSRLAGELAGVDFQNLPPLERVLEADVPSGADVALRLRPSDGAGPDLPGLLLLPREERRHVVAPASGFWRWAAWGGEAREAYRRLWAAVGGELLRAGDPAAPVAGPEDRVVLRGEPVRWRVDGAAGQEVRVEIRAARPDAPAEAPEPAEEEPVMDTVMGADEEGRFVTPPLPPGPYAYRLTRSGEEEALGEGPFDVDPYAADLELRPDPPDPEAAEEGGGPEDAALDAERGEVDGAAAGAPLRTHPLPYLLALAFLCVEWVGRRRAGLR